MKNCLWNWNVTKIFDSLGIEQQVHGHFFLVNDHIAIVDYFKFQQLKCVVYRNIQQEVVGKSSIQNQKGLIM